MKPSLPGPSLVVGLMACVLFAAWLGVAGPFDLSRVEKWQTLISALVAAIGIFFAVRNVSRQVRINILMREEDRIEKQLPGLRNAVNYLEPFLDLSRVGGFHGTTGEFAKRGFGTSGSTFEEDVERALPATDGATQAEVLDRLMSAYRCAHAAQGTRSLKEMLERTIGDPAQWAPGELDKHRTQIDGAIKLFEQQGAHFSDEMARLKGLVTTVKARISLYERRRARIRREIEHYFGD